eukprot:TRINITY_DN5363_c0_g1_i1.p1 TRINITY_DN5363_c0_g1~~TRINITY_DN5363_c0_g1_i1.p1  ORF type:complete len:195 (-),score=35.81 TRINITY_DN5363_c0_g1_i1:136-648(-)
MDEMNFHRGLWGTAMDNNLPKLRSLLAKDSVNPSAPDAYGFTALHYAARAGFIDIGRALLEAGADPDAVTGSGKETPLHRASYMGHTPFLTLLLNHGADPTKVNADGETALLKAVMRQKDSAAVVLARAAFAALDVGDRRGRTARTEASAPLLSRLLDQRIPSTVDRVQN